MLNPVFTSDMTSNKVETWKCIFGSMAHRQLSILEVGSYEGRSAIVLLEMLPHAHLTCVDTFAGGPDLPDLDGVEERFDSNLEPYAGRFEKMKSRSLPALDLLVQQRRTYDVIFIDGSHRRDDVLIDSVLAWHLLANEGYLIWDDYLWSHKLVPDGPKPAIDAFLVMNEGRFRTLYQDWQVIVQKVPAADAWVPKERSNVARTFRNAGLFLSGRLAC